MPTIKHIFKVAPSGEILSIGLAGASNVPEGLDEDGNLIVYWYGASPLSLGDFMEIHYYDISSSSLVQRPQKPNPFAFWDFDSGTWDWNSGKFLDYIREERTYKLTSTDWTQVADAPLTAEQLAEVASYRQALRDLTTPIIANPEQYPTEESIPWPTPPSFIA